MKLLILITGALTLLALAHEGESMTRPKRKTPLPLVVTDLIIPRDTLKAGQDIELRKVQAMLSGARPKKAVNAESRR